MVKKSEQCMSCGGGPLKRETREVTFEYKGEVLTYPQPGAWCQECGECFLDTSDDKATDLLLYDFRATINGHLTTGDIRRIRKKLGFTQKQAGEIIGGGHNAFSRYEKGIAHPSRGTENFLRILDKHPHLIDELGSEKHPEKAA
jgi:HTH-type transcriptional regulator/antitoxin MqsA